MIDIRILIIAICSAFAIGGLSSWWITADYKEAKYTAIISTMKLDAAKAVQAATEKVIAKERENTQIAIDLEITHNETVKTLDNVKADNERLTAELGGLYDRNSTASNCSVPPTPTASSSTSIAPTGSKLSTQLTQLLLSESRRADEAAAYAKTCYDWVRKINDK